MIKQARDLSRSGTPVEIAEPGAGFAHIGIKANHATASRHWVINHSNEPHCRCEGIGIGRPNKPMIGRTLDGVAEPRPR
jgi:hypothetical protein